MRPAGHPGGSSGGYPGLQPRAGEWARSHQLACVREEGEREEEGGLAATAEATSQVSWGSLPTRVPEPTLRSVHTQRRTDVHQVYVPRQVASGALDAHITNSARQPFKVMAAPLTDGEAAEGWGCNLPKIMPKALVPREPTLPPTPPCPQGRPEEGPQRGGQGPLCSLPLSSSPLWLCPPVLHLSPTLCWLLDSTEPSSTMAGSSISPWPIHSYHMDPPKVKAFTSG